MDQNTVAPQAPQKSKKGIVVAIVVIVVAAVAWYAFGSSSETPAASDEMATSTAPVATTTAE